jgi:hypothetical protein
MVRCPFLLSSSASSCLVVGRCRSVMADCGSRIGYTRIVANPCCLCLPNRLDRLSRMSVTLVQTSMVRCSFLPLPPSFLHLSAIFPPSRIQVLSQDHISSNSSNHILHPSSISPPLYPLLLSSTGPFWTLTTLAFTLYVFSSLSASISAYLAGTPATQDIGQISLAAALVYTYGIGWPALLWGIVRWFGGAEVGWTVVEALALYGCGSKLFMICLNARASLIFHDLPLPCRLDDDLHPRLDPLHHPYPHSSVSSLPFLFPSHRCFFCLTLTPFSPLLQLDPRRSRSWNLRLVPVRPRHHLLV